MKKRVGGRGCHGHSDRFHTAITGGQLRGPSPNPILGKAENIPYFREISQSRAPEAVRTPKTYPILGRFDKITPFFLGGGGGGGELAIQNRPYRQSGTTPRRRREYRQGNSLDRF